MKAVFTVLMSLVIGSYALAHGHYYMEEKFKMMDTDKDGKISAMEHEAGATDMFKKMDANTDGRVTVEEMESAHKMKDQKGHHKNITAAKRLSMVDANADKVITADEHTTASKNMFKEMDTDKDGFLTSKEMKEGHEKKMKK